MTTIIFVIGTLSIICCALGVMLSAAHKDIEDLEYNLDQLEDYTDELEAEINRLRIEARRRA